MGALSPVYVDIHSSATLIIDGRMRILPDKAPQARSACF